MLREIRLSESGEMLEGGTIVMKETSPDCFEFSYCDGDMWLGLGLGTYSEEWLRNLVDNDNHERRESYQNGMADGWNTGHSTFEIVTLEHDNLPNIDDCDLDFVPQTPLDALRKGL